MISTFYIVGFGVLNGVIALIGWSSGSVLYDKTRGNTNIRLLNQMMSRVCFEYKDFPKKIYGYEKNIYLEDWMCDYKTQIIIDCIIKIIDDSNNNFMENKCDGLSYIYNISTIIQNNKQ